MQYSLYKPEPEMVIVVTIYFIALTLSITLNQYKMNNNQLFKPYHVSMNLPRDGLYKIQIHSKTRYYQSNSYYFFFDLVTFFFNKLSESFGI